MATERRNLLLFYRPDIDNPQPEERTATKFIFYVATPDLKQKARGYLGAMRWCQNEMDPQDGASHEVDVRYNRRARAKKVRAVLEDLRYQRLHGEKPSATVIERGRNNQSGQEVRMEIREFMAMDGDMERVASEVDENPINHVHRYPHRILRLSRFYRNLIGIEKGASVRLVDHALDGADARKLEKKLGEHRDQVLDFLKTLTALHHATRPKIKQPAKRKKHVYKIRFNSDTDVFRNGTRVDMNNACKAAVVVLALLEMNKFSVGEFAALYKPLLRLQVEDRHMHANRFYHAVHALKKHLPHIEAEDLGAGYRRVHGVRFVNRPEMQLRDWLEDFRA